MERDWMDFFKDEIDERVNSGIQNARVLDLKNIMETFGVSEEKAMDVLKVPQNQRATYAGLVRQL